MLKDLLAPGLRLVVCGTAASTVSAARGLYYAGPGNKFWQTLCEVGLTNRQLRPEEYEELLSFGIGLTDVVKGQAGSDAAIDFSLFDPQRLREKLLLFAPGILAFNGKKAAQVFLGQRQLGYGLQAETVGRNTRLFVAPSTSGAANRSWDVNFWKALAKVVGDVIPGCGFEETMNEVIGNATCSDQ
jgi:double-stranded uracil-DNA glycosylase